MRVIVFRDRFTLIFFYRFIVVNVVVQIVVDVDGVSGCFQDDLRTRSSGMGPAILQDKIYNFQQVIGLCYVKKILLKKDFNTLT